MKQSKFSRSRCIRGAPTRSVRYFRSLQNGRCGGFATRGSSPSCSSADSSGVSSPSPNSPDAGAFDCAGPAQQLCAVFWSNMMKGFCASTCVNLSRGRHPAQISASNKPRHTRKDMVEVSGRRRFERDTRTRQPYNISFAESKQRTSYRD